MSRVAITLTVRFKASQRWKLGKEKRKLKKIQINLDWF